MYVMYEKYDLAETNEIAEYAGWHRRQDMPLPPHRAAIAKEKIMVHPHAGRSEHWARKRESYRKRRPSMNFLGTTTVGERGQIVIPAEARQELGIEPGQKFVVMAGHGGSLTLMKADTLSRFAEAFLQHSEKVEAVMRDILDETDGADVDAEAVPADDQAPVSDPAPATDQAEDTSSGKKTTGKPD